MADREYRCSFGPWNIHTGADPFGPPVRKEVAFARKLELVKELGYHAIQFHDDDVVPAGSSASSASATTCPPAPSSTGCSATSRSSPPARARTTRPPSSSAAPDPRSYEATAWARSWRITVTLMRPG